MNILYCVWLYKEVYILLTKYNEMTSKKSVVINICVYRRVFLWEIFLKISDFLTILYSYKVWRLLRKQNGFGIRSKTVLCKQWKKPLIIHYITEKTLNYFLLENMGIMYRSPTCCVHSHTTVYESDSRRNITFCIRWPEYGRGTFFKG